MARRKQCSLISLMAAFALATSVAIAQRSSPQFSFPPPGSISSQFGADVFSTNPQDLQQQPPSAGTLVPLGASSQNNLGAGSASSQQDLPSQDTGRQLLVSQQSANSQSQGRSPLTLINVGQSSAQNPLVPQHQSTPASQQQSQSSSNQRQAQQSVGVGSVNSNSASSASASSISAPSIIAIREPQHHQSNRHHAQASSAAASANSAASPSSASASVPATSNRQVAASNHHSASNHHQHNHQHQHQHQSQHPANVHSQIVANQAAQAAGLSPSHSERQAALDAARKAEATAASLAAGSGRDYHCPDSFGFFRHHKSCDKYYACENGTATLKLCGNGLMFDDSDPKRENCAYPFSVDCGADRTDLEAPISTPHCPRLYGLFADTANCRVFYSCWNGEASKYECPPGLAYDNDQRVCVWADLVDRCDQSEVSDGFVCPDPTEADQPGHYTRHAHPTDCRKFYVCIEGVARPYGCSFGTVFNVDSLQCDEPNNVSGCEKYYGDMDPKLAKKLAREGTQQGGQSSSGLNTKPQRET